MMSKKHYNKIADLLWFELKNVESGDGAGALIDVSNRLADFFEKDNPRFNKKLFLSKVRDDINCPPAILISEKMEAQADLFRKYGGE